MSIAIISMFPFRLQSVTVTVI